MRTPPFLRLCLLLGLALAGCNQTPSSTAIEMQSQKATAMTQQVTIKVGEQGESLKKRYPDLVKIDHQPAGIDFYKMDWDQRPRGSVTVDHEKYSFVIEDVLGVLADQDLGPLTPEGLSDIDISAGLSVPSPSLISHDEARLKTYAILHRIVQAGWKPLVGRGDPRISGKDQLNYMFVTSNVNGLDPRNMPTFEEWMRIESRTPWSFYADHLYLTVSFTREHTLTDPTKPGAYLLNFNIKSEAEEFRAYISPIDRPKWKELLLAELELYPRERAKAEAALRAKGIKIDESYEDPPVPDLK